MAMFVVMAGAAALEVHRALHRQPGDPDVEALQKREAELKAALEATQRELRAEKEQLERAQGVTEQLSSTVNELMAAKAGLQAERDQLADQSKLLLRRFAELEESAASLHSSNEGLLEQVATLKAAADAEVARTEAQLNELRAEVASAVKAWSDGDMAADAFLSRMANLGVEVTVAPGGLPALPMPQQITPSTELQLTMDATWTSKMQLVTDSKERMSRLLTAAAARQNGLPPRPAAAVTFPAVKTPPRDAGMSRRLDMTGFSVSGLTPRGSRASSQGLLDAMAASSISEAAVPAAAATAPEPSQPLRAIENTAPVAAAQQGGSFFAPKPKVDKKTVKRASKQGIPKLEFAAFDSDDHFGGGRAQQLMRL